jgi:hypothetical protein
MFETHEDRLHREYDERVYELSECAKQYPEDWEMFAEIADEIETLRKQLEDELAKLP